MTPEAINRAIAEWRGWKQGYGSGNMGIFTDPSGEPKASLPNYYHDLNAVREAFLKLSDDQRHEFTKHMVAKSNERNVHIFALGSDDWCECLLRTLGIWRDGE